MDRSPRSWPAAWVYLGALVFGCAGEAPQPDPRPLVAVSVLPQKYFVEAIAGDRVRVEVMVPPGANPASYEPRIEQMRAVAGARLYLKVGHPHLTFETTWLDRLLADTEGLRVVDSSAGIETDDGDPHLWVSPRHARALARQTHAGLSALLPRDREVLDAGLARLETEIQQVDAELRELLAAKRGATFLVFHPAWGHLAREYGLVQLSIEEDRKEPSARQLAQVLERARQLGARVVFAQPQFDSRAARLVAQEIGARLEWIDPLALDWPDNLREVGQQVARAATP